MTCSQQSLTGTRLDTNTSLAMTRKPFKLKQFGAIIYALVDLTPSSMQSTEAPSSIIVLVDTPFTIEVNDEEAPQVVVQRIELDAVSYCCDVRVHISHGHAELCDNATFLQGVNAALTAAGYSGSRLGRAELGMQEDDCIVLESPRDFERFAMTRGWQYPDGYDSWEASSLIQSIPFSAEVAFTASNGAVYGVSVAFVAENHAKRHAATAGGVAAALRTLTLPALKQRPAVVVDWVREMAWEDVEPMLRQLKPSPALDLQQEYHRAALKAQGLAASKWREPA